MNRNIPQHSTSAPTEDSNSSHDSTPSNSTGLPPTIRPPHTRGARDYVGIGLRGVCMGSADIVPGVSGGTMAFILGIYEELIDSIRTLGRPEFLRAVGTLKWRTALSLLNWKFLGALGAGIGLAVATLANVLESLLTNHPVLVWSFFFGLIVASVWTVSKRIEQWSIDRIASVAIGTIAGFLFVGLVPVQTPETWWFLMISGALASCALILPGISGAFLLVLLGKYQFVLAAVKGLQIVPIFFVGLGASVGVVSFAQILGWLFRRFHDLVIALLTGLMIGSLRKVWPWKEDLNWLRDEAGEFVLHSDGTRIVIEQANFLPSLENHSGEIFPALALAAGGLILVLVLDRLARRGQRS